MTDLRAPGAVRDEFQRAVAASLGSHGFVPNKSYVRLKRSIGTATHLIGFSSSQRNTPGHVACFVSFTVEDRKVRKLVPKWTAGGELTGPAFALDAPVNVAEETNAQRLTAVIARNLEFFDLLSSPVQVLNQVCRRYVPGFNGPSIVVPYLRAQIGPSAARDYATALLDALPELWPAFVAARAGTERTTSSVLDDHGTQLGVALNAADQDWDLVPPADVLPCGDRQAAHLRMFLGRQLRAWGEPKAAARLRSLPDLRIKALGEAQGALPGPLVDGIAAARLVLEELGEARDPRRLAPSPRHFQYAAKHASFAES
jgi:hypothetical protein